MQAFRRLMSAQAEERLRPLRDCITATRACLLCAEQAAQRCHRQIIAEYLTGYGYDVQHL
jgi:hypothetical protein